MQTQDYVGLEDGYGADNHHPLDGVISRAEGVGVYEEAGILCNETHEHVIRFAPTLVITKDEIDWAVARIKKVIQE
jgi:acetylornithine/succinyldiaminopimelate/putrescine aminotransferase